MVRRVGRHVLRFMVGLVILTLVIFGSFELLQYRAVQWFVAISSGISAAYMVGYAMLGLLEKAAEE